MKKKIESLIIILVLIIIITTLISMLGRLQHQYNEMKETNERTFNQTSELPDEPDDTSISSKNSSSDNIGKTDKDENNVDNIEAEPSEIDFYVFGISGQITSDDLIVTPGKKTVQKGETFNINIAVDSSEFADYSNEEWEEVIEENIDSITYRSTKSSVAYVDRQGNVTGKKKGSAYIRTTINFASGETVTYKTKVYVTESE